MAWLCAVVSRGAKTKGSGVPRRERRQRKYRGTMGRHDSPSDDCGKINSCYDRDLCLRLLVNGWCCLPLEGISQYFSAGCLTINHRL